MDELKNKVTKTGTTLVGIVCKDGVVVAADRQATAGMMVAEKNTRKIAQINDYLIAAGAGLVSDIQLLVRLTRAELKLKEIKSKTRSTINEGANLFATLVYQNIRKFSPIPGIVGFIIAGFDDDGAKLYLIDPAGAINKVDDYTSEGSGSVFVYGVMEAGYKKDMTLAEGIKLARESVKASTQRDVNSGYGLDIYTVTEKGIQLVVDETIESKFVKKEAQ